MSELRRRTEKLLSEVPGTADGLIGALRAHDRVLREVNLDGEVTWTAVTDQIHHFITINLRITEVLRAKIAEQRAELQALKRGGHD